MQTNTKTEISILTPDMYSPVDVYDDLTGKIVVEKIEHLRREYQNAENQLFYVTGGNGAKPNARGTKVFGYSLASKKHCYIRRYDVEGVVDKATLPEWAKTDLAEIQKQIKREEKEVR